MATRLPAFIPMGKPLRASGASVCEPPFLIGSGVLYLVVGGICFCIDTGALLSTISWVAKAILCRADGRECPDSMTSGCVAYRVHGPRFGDCVCARRQIHRFEHPERALERMVRVVKSGGRVLIWIYGRENQVLVGARYRSRWPCTDGRRQGRSEIERPHVTTRTRHAAG
jgi:hypothetical protein